MLSTHTHATPPRIRKTDVDQHKAMVMAIMPDFSRRRRRGEESASSSSSGGGISSGSFPVFQQSSNAEYGRMVKAIGDLQGDVVRYRAIQMLLLVACVKGLV